MCELQPYDILFSRIWDLFFGSLSLALSSCRRGNGLVREEPVVLGLVLGEVWGLVPEEL
jgi:hypothetical protein